jgi:hypothetical protein
VNQTFSLSSLSQTEKIIYWTIILTPLWWLMGIQPLFYSAVIALLLLINFRIDKVIRESLPACIWAWLAMAIVMIWTAALGLEETGFKLKDLAAVVVTFFKSYFLIFACLTIPFWSQVRNAVITRAVTWMSIGCLVNLGIQMIILVIGFENLVFAPPLARLAPGDKSSLLVKLADFSPFFGISLPRSVLHTPDPPILGVVALLSFLICLGESDRSLRRWGLISAIASLLISFSRLSWLCGLLILLTILFFRSPLSRHVGLWLAFVGTFLSTLVGFSFQEFFGKSIAFFDSARSNSSEERALVVKKTLEAWQEKPWLGWGFIRGQVRLYEQTYITLGSFSSYAAVLYLHGIVGLLVLIVAMALTLAFFYNRAIEGDSNSQLALAGLMSLYVSLNATPLSWMAVYLWFFFLWLGALMSEIQQQRNTISSWQQFTKKQPIQNNLILKNY